jgi:hypothetical protein
VASVQPVVVAVELELMAVLACAAVARLLGVAGGLVAEGLVVEEQKMGVDCNMRHHPPHYLASLPNPLMLSFSHTSEHKSHCHYYPLRCLPLLGASVWRHPQASMVA